MKRPSPPLPAEAQRLSAAQAHEKYPAFCAYVEAMAAPSSYATEAELEVLSRLLQRPIHVYRIERVADDGTGQSPAARERLATVPQWTVGDERLKSPPITLRHRIHIDRQGRGAASNDNHFDAVIGLSPAQAGALTLEKLASNVQPVRGDGACLFRAVAMFLDIERDSQGAEMSVDLHRAETQAHLKWRADVVAWEKDNALTEVGGLAFIDLVV